MAGCGQPFSSICDPQQHPASQAGIQDDQCDLSSLMESQPTDPNPSGMMLVTGDKMLDDQGMGSNIAVSSVTSNDGTFTAEGSSVLPGSTAVQRVMLNKTSFSHGLPSETVTSQELMDIKQEAKDNGIMMNSCLSLETAEDMAYWNKTQESIKEDPVSAQNKDIHSIKMEQKSPHELGESSILERLHTYQATTEPTPGGVYIDTALDPTLGHRTPIGSIQLLSCKDMKVETSSQCSQVSPKQTARKSTGSHMIPPKQTARKSTGLVLHRLNQTLKTTAQGSTQVKRRGRPPKSKRKIKDSHLTEQSKSWTKQLVKPGRKCKLWQKADLELVKKFIRTNKVTAKKKIQLLDRRLEVRVEHLEWDLVSGALGKFETGALQKAMLKTQFKRLAEAMGSQGSSTKLNGASVEIKSECGEYSENVYAISSATSGCRTLNLGTSSVAANNDSTHLLSCLNAKSPMDVLPLVNDNSLVSEAPLSTNGRPEEVTDAQVASEDTEPAAKLARKHKTQSLSSSAKQCKETSDMCQDVSVSESQVIPSVKSRKVSRAAKNNNSTLKRIGRKRDFNVVSNDGTETIGKNNDAEGKTQKSCLSGIEKNEASKEDKVASEMDFGLDETEIQSDCSTPKENKAELGENESLKLSKGAQGRKGHSTRGRRPRYTKGGLKVKFTLPHRSQIFFPLSATATIGNDTQSTYNESNSGTSTTVGQHDGSSGNDHANPTLSQNEDAILSQLTENKSTVNQDSITRKESSDYEVNALVDNERQMVADANVDNQTSHLSQARLTDSGLELDPTEIKTVTEQMISSKDSNTADFHCMHDSHTADKTGERLGMPVEENKNLDVPPTESRGMSGTTECDTESKDITKDDDINGAEPTQGSSSQSQTVLDSRLQKVAEDPGSSHRRRSSARVMSYAEFGYLTDDSNTSDNDEDGCSSDDWEEGAGFKKHKTKSTSPKKTRHPKVPRGNSPSKRGRRKHALGQAGCGKGSSGKTLTSNAQPMDGDGSQETSTFVNDNGHLASQQPELAPSTSREPASDLTAETKSTPEKPKELHLNLMPSVNSSSFPCKMMTNKKHGRFMKKSKGNQEPPLPCILKTVGFSAGEQNSVYQCPICPYTTESTDGAGKHIREQHSKQLHLAVCEELEQKAIPYIGCRHCDFIALNQLALWNHFADYHNISGIKEEYEEEVFMANSGLSTQTKYRCKKCQYQGSTLFTIEKHSINMHHEKDLLFVCYSCSQFQTTSTEHLMLHIKQHQMSSLFSCTATIIDKDGNEVTEIANRMASVVPVSAAPPMADQQTSGNPGVNSEFSNSTPNIVSEDLCATHGLTVASAVGSMATSLALPSTSAGTTYTDAVNRGETGSMRYSQHSRRRRGASNSSHGMQPGSGRGRGRKSSQWSPVITTIQLASATSNAVLPSNMSNIDTSVAPSTALPNINGSNMVNVPYSNGSIVTGHAGRWPVTGQHPLQPVMRGKRPSFAQAVMPQSARHNFQPMQTGYRQPTTYMPRGLQPQQPLISPGFMNQSGFLEPVQAGDNLGLNPNTKEDAEYIISIALVPLNKGSPIEMITKTQRWCEPVYQCLLCPADFDAAIKVPEHMKLKHPNFIYGLVLRSDSNCFLFCDHCSYITQNHTAMSLHYFVYHQVIGVMGRMGIKKNKADDLNQTASVSGKNMYVCLHCSYRDRVRARMVQHSVQMHGTRFIAFRCIKCNYVNARFGSFVRHHRDVHQSLPQLCSVILIDRARRVDTNIKHSEPPKESKFNVSFSPVVSLPFVLCNMTLFGQDEPPQLQSRQFSHAAYNRDAAVVLDKEQDRGTRSHFTSEQNPDRASNAGVTTIYLDESDSDNDVVVTAEVIASADSKQTNNNADSPNKSHRIHPRRDAFASGSKQQQRMGPDDVIVIEDDIPARRKVQIIREYALPPTPPTGSASLLMEVSED